MASAFSARQMQDTRLQATYKLRRELSHADRSLRRTLAHVSLLEALDEFEADDDDVLPRLQHTATATIVCESTCGMDAEDQEEQPLSPVESERQDQMSDEETNSSSSDSVSDEDISDWDDDSDDDGTIIYETGGDENSVIQLLSAAVKLSGNEANTQAKSISVNEVVPIRPSLQHTPAFATISVEECSDDF